MHRLILLLLLTLFGAANAEMGGDAYRSDSALQTDAEREAVRVAIEAARLREQEREREQQAIAARQARALAEEEARKPAAQRLFEAKCRQCHTLEVVETRRHSLPGWAFTLARMRWWNGAELPLADLATITGHLTQSRPANIWRAVFEWTLTLVMALILPLVLVWRKLGYRKEHRK